MIFRKTIETRKKKFYASRNCEYKSEHLVETKTYWFSFIPLITIEIKEM